MTDRNCVADGRERIAQLVGKHREEFIFLTACFFNRVKEPRVVDGDGHANGQTFGDLHLALRIATASITGNEADDTDGSFADFKGDADDGARPELPNDLAMLFALCEAE